MEIILQRGTPTSKSIPGEMFIQGQHAAYTLERPGVCILAGRYKVGLYPSPHFGRLMPILENVPSRQDILIHWGNYPTDSEGCILVGKQRDLGADEIFQTRAMFDELFLPIQAAVEAEGCFIEVLDPPSNHTEVQEAATAEN
jgi:Family of unknown function (DUF5675)